MIFSTHFQLPPSNTWFSMKHFFYRDAIVSEFPINTSNRKTIKTIFCTYVLMEFQCFAIGIVEINNRMFHTKPNSLLLDSYTQKKNTWTLRWLWGNSELSKMEFQHFQLKNHFEPNDRSAATSKVKQNALVKLMRANVFRCAIISFGVYVCLKVRNFYNWKPNLL